jgi:hypothetical protein
MIQDPSIQLNRKTERAGITSEALPTSSLTPSGQRQACESIYTALRKLEDMTLHIFSVNEQGKRQRPTFGQQSWVATEANKHETTTRRKNHDVDQNKVVYGACGRKPHKSTAIDRPVDLDEDPAGMVYRNKPKRGPRPPRA